MISPFIFMLLKDWTILQFREYTKQVLGAYANSGIGCVFNTSLCCSDNSVLYKPQWGLPGGMHRRASWNEKVREEGAVWDPSGVCSVWGSYLSVPAIRAAFQWICACLFSKFQCWPFLELLFHLNDAVSWSIVVFIWQFGFIFLNVGLKVWL